MDTRLDNPTEGRHTSESEYVFSHFLTNTPLSPVDKEILENLGQKEWDGLLLLAAKNKLIPEFYEQKRDKNLTIKLDPGRLIKIQNQYLVNGARNSLLLHEAGLILAQLNRVQIPVIGLKGVYLQENIYESVAEREMDDLDFLVKYEDIPKTIEILQGLGYQKPGHFNIKNENRDIKHIAPMLKSNGAIVEIHWTILQEDDAIEINPTGLWDRAVNAKIAGEHALALCTEDLIMHLSIHTTYQHHLHAGLRDLLDLDRIIRNNSDDIDWTLLVKITQDWKAGRILWLTFHLLENIFHTPIPDDLFGKVLSEPPENDIIEKSEALLFSKVANPLALTPDLFTMSKTHSVISKIRIILSRIFLPKLAISRIYGVSPRSLTIYFYYFRRLWELAKSYAGITFKIVAGQKDLQSKTKPYQIIEEIHSWLSGKSSQV